MVGKAIYNILVNDVTVSGLTTRIYPVVAPQNAANPCIVYNIDTTPEDDKDGRPTIFYIDVQIDVYTDHGGGGYSDNETLSQAVIDALDRYSGTNNGLVIDTIILEGREDFYDPEAESYRTMIDVRVRLKG